MTTRRAARAAVAASAIGVVAIWTSDGPVRLDGLEGPNNGWLVLILSGLALAWTPPMARGSWIGIVGVLGAAVVMFWTAVESWLDSRAVLEASAGVGLFLISGASVLLAAVATARALGLVAMRRNGAGGGKRSS